MTLYFIGLGLDSYSDISVRGLEIVKSCKYVYLEAYTSKLNCSVSDLEKFYGCDILVADRELVEKGDQIVANALENDVAFLVVGDIFSATTHNDLRLRAINSGVKVSYVHNASVLTAIGVTGLELYKFGRVASIPFMDVNSPIEVLEKNKSIGLHTLFLLDIKADEDRYMTANEAIKYLISKKVSSKVVACARLGSSDMIVKYGSLESLKDFDFGTGMHCLIVPAQLHFMEEEALELFK